MLDNDDTLQLYKLSSVLRPKARIDLFLFLACLLLLITILQVRFAAATFANNHFLEFVVPENIEKGQTSRNNHSSKLFVYKKKKTR